MAEAKIIDIDDEPSTEFMMDGSQLEVHSTQLYPDNADLSRLAPVLLIPTPPTNPSPLIVIRLSGVGSRGEQLKQGAPDFLGIPRRSQASARYNLST